MNGLDQWTAQNSERLRTVNGLEQWTAQNSERLTTENGSQQWATQNSVQWPGVAMDKSQTDLVQ